jgi:RNA polymerase sigma-70 factor (ECF subfamily)
MVRPDPETIELLGRIRAGDDDACNALLARYQARIRQIVSARLGPKLRRLADSEDVLQEVLLATAGKLETFEPQSDGALLHWFGVAVKNRIVDLARFGGRGKRDLDREVVVAGGEAETDVVSPLDRVAGEGATPSQDLAKRERMELFHLALDNLKPEHRELIVLRDLTGMSWQEIAEQVGAASDEAARKRYGTAAVQFARALREVGFGPEGGETLRS